MRIYKREPLCWKLERFGKSTFGRLFSSLLLSSFALAIISPFLFMTGAEYIEALGTYGTKDFTIGISSRLHGF